MPQLGKRKGKNDSPGTEITGEDYIDKLTEEQFATLIKRLWATSIWQNKDHKVEQLLKDNGLQKLRCSLEALLHGNEPIEKRWDEYRGSD